MKLKKFKPLPKKLVKRKKHGFALIASLTLMMLLALLAVGIMATASTQSRISAQTILQAEARQQALVGLDAALGELQVTLGPDCRVTASSGISEKAATQNILGVWDSWTGPIYGTAKQGNRKGSSIRETYEAGRASMFRKWLISSRNPAELKRFDAAGSLGTSRPGHRICLVGEGTLGAAGDRADNCVFADLITMPSSGGRKACYAWWIGGENQKAKVNIRDRQVGSNPQEVLRATWDTPAPIFKDGTFNPGPIEDPEKLLTMRSLAHVDGVTQFGMPYFFDVTTSSYTLPINVRTGGLKQDLCLLLGKEGNFAAAKEFAAESTRDCPLVEYGDGLNPGSERNLPIGSWQNLYAYYNCWPNGEANDSKNVTARLLGDVATAYTRISGVAIPNQGSNRDPQKLEEYSPSGGCSIYDSRSMMHTGDEAAGYARTPVLLSYMCTFGLVEEDQKNSDGSPVMTKDEKQVHRLGMCFSPMFLWWNPYNVPMKIRGEQLWAQSIPYKTIWLQTYAVSQAGTWNYTWQTYAMHQNSGDTGFGMDYGNYFLNSVNSGKDDIVFAPGEILFFSHGNSRTNRNGAFDNPLVLGYNPSAVAGYNARFYTMGAANQSTDPGVASAYNMEQGNFKLRLRLGINASGGAYTTDGVWFAPQVVEAISVMNGFSGRYQDSGSDTAIGKRGHNPQRFLMGWYDPATAGEEETVICDENRNDSYWRADGSQRDSAVPYFIAAVGVAPKSANRNLDSRVLEGEDFRTKSWQHSSPAFWGSMIIKPDNQQRQYHPYQLAVLDVGSGMNACPMDSIGRNGVLGINSGGEQVSFASVLELPVHPPFSLAGFSGMRLQPGWYQASSGGSLPALRRMLYQSGVPGVGIGNAFADPCLPADGVYAYHKSNIPTGTGGNGQVFSDFYDHGLLINDAMWDRWFCSSVSDMPNKKAKQLVDEFFADRKGKDATRSTLPVSRYVRTGEPYENKDIVSKIMKKDGWKYIAQYLMIDGGFNVNSTSVDAWAAVLQGLARRQLVTNSSGKLALVEGSSEDNTESVLFPRFMVSTANKAIDPNGGYSMMMGASDLRSGSSSGLAAWGDIRELDSAQIRQLAEAMVEQVRQRGPFLNMSDFVNRRLDKRNEEHAMKGALQAAIDNAGLNDGFDDETTDPQGGGDLYKFPAAEEGSIYTAAPGYLIQSDVLLSLGNILTVRDDTFTVRAYGCVRTETDGVLAQAWCEAVVQRTIEYVDPRNRPADSDYEPDGAAGKNKLTSTNRNLGRKFRIVSFKWLDAWDI